MLHDWPFWLGGITLAGICITHWLWIRRMLGVSGRYTAIVNRLRFGEVKEVSPDDDALAKELEAATLAAFGEEALAEFAKAPVLAEVPVAQAIEKPQPQSLSAHLCFLASLTLGGFLAAVRDGRFAASLSLRGESIPRLAGSSVFAQALLLFGGGLLVGIGTRMAGGCTSGHGLCGTSRFQRGSMLATAAFFLSGVIITRLLFGAKP